MQNLYLAIPLASLFGAIVAGFFGKKIGRTGAHVVTIAGVGASFLMSMIAFNHIVFEGGEIFNQAVYTWMVSDGIRFEIGFLVDSLTVVMMCVVTGVSLMVHIYTIGYMHDDPGYQRFFSYISLFTFSMLMLVMSNNFMQLFFGWEAVGLVSYLLIGFWFKKDTAIFANMKAFLVNRVGDFGFILGIAAIVMYTGSLDYKEVFQQAEQIAKLNISIFGETEFALMTVICILLFVGAMGKSAQVPLHVWLPDSMEGPTPISALIHAATMVTAGIFMVARMSPLYELSETALSFIMIIGAITALFMGLIGIVQNDIKRVVAYSTLSQLGYMTVALGASAYSAAVFHLMTHAFFKALLFLAAGSIIIALHHEQDMRKMGNMRKYTPYTYITMLIGTLALIGFPGFSGFFSKDAIIEAVHHSSLFGSGFAYFAVLSGVIITSFYSFRLYFLVFHGNERMDEHTKSHCHESPWVVTVPLMILAVPSIFIGWFTIEPMLFGDFFKDVITVLPQHDVLAQIGRDYHGQLGFILHGLTGFAVWFAFAGFILAWFMYVKEPAAAEKLKQKMLPVYNLLVNKYWFDAVYQKIFGEGSVSLGKTLWKVGDVSLIDGLLVNGSAKLVGLFAGFIRHMQTGYLYHYAFAMIIGVIYLLTKFVLF